MTVSDIIEGMQWVFRHVPESRGYGVAFASYIDDGSGGVEYRMVEAFHWDEDREFFLVPSGSAKYYGLEAREFDAESFLACLSQAIDQDIAQYCAFARSRIKVLEDDSVASLNSPLWGTGYHEQARLLYFYHGNDPENAA